jgi:hypothetical protein
VLELQPPPTIVKLFVQSYFCFMPAAQWLKHDKPLRLPTTVLVRSSNPSRLLPPVKTTKSCRLCLGAGWCGATKISSTPLEVSSSGLGASGSYLIDAGGKFLHLFLGHTGDEMKCVFFWLCNCLRSYWKVSNREPCKMYEEILQVVP